MRSLAASRWQIFWMLQLPNAMPYIFAGLEIAMIFALIGAIVAEFVGAQSGLGMLIQSMNFTMDVAGQFSVLLILSVIGLRAQWHRHRHSPPGAVLGRLAEARCGSCKGKKGRSVMKRTIALLSLALLAAAVTPASAQTTVRVGWCARTVSSAAAPFAIATKIGWFAKDGIKVELVPLPGSTDCVKTVATKDVALCRCRRSSRLPIIRPQGVKALNFYTAYQGNIYGIAVPEDTPGQDIRRPQGQEHRRHLDGVGRRHHRAGAWPRRRA